MMILSGISQLRKIAIKLMSDSVHAIKKTTSLFCQVIQLPSLINNPLPCFKYCSFAVITPINEAT